MHGQCGGETHFMVILYGVISTHLGLALIFFYMMCGANHACSCVCEHFETCMWI